MNMFRRFAAAAVLGSMMAGTAAAQSGTQRELAEEEKAALKIFRDFNACAQTELPAYSATMAPHYAAIKKHQEYVQSLEEELEEKAKVIAAARAPVGKEDIARTAQSLGITGEQMWWLQAVLESEQSDVFMALQRIQDYPPKPRLPDIPSPQRLCRERMEAGGTDTKRAEKILTAMDEKYGREIVDKLLHGQDMTLPANIVINELVEKSDLAKMTDAEKAVIDIMAAFNSCAAAESEENRKKSAPYYEAERLHSIQIEQIKAGIKKKADVIADVYTRATREVTIEVALKAGLTPEKAEKLVAEMDARDRIFYILFAKTELPPAPRAPELAPPSYTCTEKMTAQGVDLKGTYKLFKIMLEKYGEDEVRGLVEKRAPQPR